MSACSSDPHQCTAAEAHAVDSFHLYFVYTSSYPSSYQSMYFLRSCSGQAISVGNLLKVTPQVSTNQPYVMTIMIQPQPRC